MISLYDKKTTATGRTYEIYQERKNDKICVDVTEFCTDPKFIDYYFEIPADVFLRFLRRYQEEHNII